MPQGKGKANYKVDTLIMVVEDILSNGVQLYWIEKCCHKFKKPTGTPGDPKRDIILRCQWIQQ
jgi:hypothetical protein